MWIRQWLDRSVRCSGRTSGEVSDEDLRALELRLLQRVDLAEINLADSIERLLTPSRRRTDQLVAILLVIAGMAGSWLLYLSAVPRTPVAGWAGVIGVAIVGPESPTFVTAKFSVSRTDRTEFHFVLGSPDFTVVPDRTFVLYFCGPTRFGLQLDDLNTGPLTVRADVESVTIQDSRLGDRDQCVTVSAKPAETGQSIIEGSYEAPIVHKSGHKFLYALPGVTTLVTAERGGTQARPLPVDSSISVSVSGAPSDLSVAAASPLIPDTGLLSWTWKAAVTGMEPPSRYRIAGTEEDAEAEGQWRLLISGTLIALSSSGLIWLVQPVTRRP